MKVNIDLTYYIGDWAASHSHFKNVSSPAVGAQILAVGLPVSLQMYGHIYTRIAISVKEAISPPLDIPPAF